MNTTFRITKREWATLGGLRNSELFRVERGGRWYYYRAYHEV